MKTLEQIKTKAKVSAGLNTVEDAVAVWYKQPKLHVVLTEELGKKIAECYLDGFNDEDTAILCDVSTDSLRNWRSLPFIKKHERERKQFYVHEVRDGKRRDWTRLAWWLERRYPLEFSRPEVAHAISTSIHNTTNVTQNLIVSAELAEQLAERSASVSAKIDQLFANQQSSFRQVNPSLLGEDTPIQSVLPDAQSVKAIIDDKANDDDRSTYTTREEGVVDPPFPNPTGGTPHVGAGTPTDSPPRIPNLKILESTDKLSVLKTRTKRLRSKAGLNLPIADGLADPNDKEGRKARKNFDAETQKKADFIDGRVTRNKEVYRIMAEEKLSLREASAEEFKRRVLAGKVSKAAIAKANKEADRVWPRNRKNRK